MHRKRVALEDAGLLTAHHLTAVLLCQQDACLQSDVDYYPNLAMHYFPLMYQAPGTWPSFCFSNPPRFLPRHTSICSSIYLESIFPDLCTLGTISYLCFNSTVTFKRTQLITLQS